MPWIPVPAGAQQDRAAAEARYSRIEKIAIPQSLVLEVGGMTFDQRGRLFVSTRRGEIWIIDSPSAEQPRYKRFAHGLHEPLGIAYKDGVFYCAQRGELSRISDTDGDDVADRYATVYSWPLSGNYHEYTYGPVFLPDGDMLVTLNLAWTGKGESLSRWRGWMLKISPEGKMEPWATGLRSPAGFGLNAAGDIFYSENQGDWVGSGRLTHLSKGVFAGHPEGLKWTADERSPTKLRVSDISDTLGWSLYDYAHRLPGMRAPSVWFPHTLMGISTSDLLVIPNNAFGPFEGQLLVGDQGHSKIMRVFQEKVNGVYQGICFPFREGFSSGVLRLKWGAENTVYAGMTSRGWASTGKDLFGIERLVPTGLIPFEMKAVRALPDGFEIEFTKPLDASSAGSTSHYRIRDFTYRYHHAYGSPAVDIQPRRVVSVEPTDQNRRVRLKIEGMRAGYIHEIKLGNIRSAAGETLLHDVGYYTLNEIPGRAPAKPHADGHDPSPLPQQWNSDKRVSRMPAAWKHSAVKTVVIKPLPGLRYDVTLIEAHPGEKIKLVFENTDDMLHNLLLVKPGKADAVATLAVGLGLEGQSLGFVPDTDLVLFHTALVGPETSDVIYFEAPGVRDDYPFVCTYPGHAATMRGVLKIR